MDRRASIPRRNDTRFWKAPREFVLYTAASLMALLVDYATYWILATAGGLELAPAAALGYMVGLAVSYLLLTRAVFLQRRHARRPGYEMLLFFLSGLLGVTFTYVTVSLLSSLAGADLHTAKLAAVGVSFISVYLFRKLVVFAPPPAAHREDKGKTSSR